MLHVGPQMVFHVGLPWKMFHMESMGRFYM